jgi:hypothetical protein
MARVGGIDEWHLNLGNSLGHLTFDVLPGLRQAVVSLGPAFRHARLKAARVHELVDILKALVDGLLDARLVGVAGDSLNPRDETFEVVGVLHRRFLILL